MKEAHDSPKKLPYVAPTLKRFGNLTELTSAVGNKGRTDGGSMNMQKTQ